MNVLSLQFDHERLIFLQRVAPPLDVMRAQRLDHTTNGGAPHGVVQMLPPDTTMIEPVEHYST
jgi:hypothetical protein